MANARTILISLDHLVAEMAAFPFVATDALKAQVHELSPALKGKTRDLWRQAERYFVGHFPHTSLDELIALRNWTWFGDADQREIPLGEYLRQIAGKFFVSRGAFAEPKLPEGADDSESLEPAARRAWRWLTFAMPGDLLLAGLGRDGAGPARVNLICPPLQTLLEGEGYAETHLHFGIALNFPTAWASAVNVVGRPPGSGPSMTHDALHSPGAEYEEGDELGSWLVRAAIVRYILAAFLARHRSRDALRDYLDATLPGILAAALWTDSQVDSLKVAIRDLQKGKLNFVHGGATAAKQSFAILQSVYNALARVSTRTLPRSLNDVQSLDPLCDFFPNHPFAGPSVQLQLLWRGLDYLEQNPHDKEFAQLFWQVERVRGQVYRHCIQRPLTPGLMNFIRFYERKTAVTRLLSDNVAFESAGVIGGVGRGLRSLEVRTSPERDRDAQRKALRTLRSRYRGLKAGRSVTPASEGQPRGGDWANTECGIVLHFLKSRGKTINEGRPHAFDAQGLADPDAKENVCRYRWSNYFISRRKEALAIVNAVRQEPELLYFLRGLDVCRDEHGVPTWVVAPLFHLVRKEIEEISQERRLSHHLELPPLRTTVHVGEDFVHLATGLRYMDEAIEHLPLRAGDRVGHGLALGVEPQAWATKSMRLAMPREDRWLDLIWERGWHSQPRANFAPDRRAFVEDEIERLSRAIFQDQTPQATIADAGTAGDARDLVRNLFDARKLTTLGYPNRMLQSQKDQSDPATRRLERYLADANVYRNCRTIEWVTTASEGDAIEELQRLLRKRYAEGGITIEVNPISNLLVGDLTDLKNHPLWRLAPGLGNDHGLTLRLCVGSDDPLPFATTLPEEYQFLYDALVLAGRSHAEARAWLEDIRKTGWESRFTIADPT